MVLKCPEAISRIYSSHSVMINPWIKESDVVKLEIEEIGRRAEK
jgi:hypothetical protein